MPHSITDRCTGCGNCRSVCPTAAVSGSPDKQHQILPEYCIDCGTCGRICIDEAVVGEGGRPKKPVPMSQWVKPKKVGAHCISCGMCAEICPFSCLELILENPPGDRRPRAVLVRPESCVGCGQCIRICPTDYFG